MIQHAAGAEPAGDPDSAGAAELRACLKRLLAPKRSAELLDQQTIWRNRVHRARFRVDGAQRSLILKSLPLDRAHREQLAVRSWLPQLGLGEHGPPLLAVAAASDARCIWHVYDDLGTNTLERCADAPIPVAAAVRLLARIHTRASSCAFLGECREFGVGLGEHFLASGIADGLRVVERILRHDSGLSAVEGDVFERLRQCLLELRAEVPKRTRLLKKHGGPETLLHGDVWTCNIFVLPEQEPTKPIVHTSPVRRASGSNGASSNPPAPFHVRFIDWDHAGVGHASYDLSALLLRFPLGDRNAIVETYAHAVATAGWKLPPREILNTLFETAELARLASATLWPALSFHRERAAWAYERLAEVESWFAAMQPVLEDCA